MEEYQTALKYDPLHADTMCNLGSALQDLGDYMQSRYLLRQHVGTTAMHQLKAAMHR